MEVVMVVVMEVVEMEVVMVVVEMEVGLEGGC